MPNNLISVEDYKLDEGVTVADSNITPDFTLSSDDTQNISMGMYDGIGPRHGMAPIPFHNVNYDPSDVLATGGLITSENINKVTVKRRSRIFGMVPVQIADFDNASVPLKCYVFIGTVNDTVDDYLFATIGATKATISTAFFYNSTYRIYDSGFSTAPGGTYYKPAQGLDQGLHNAEVGLIQDSTFVVGRLRHDMIPSFANTFSLSDLLKLSSTIFSNWYCSTTSAQISGKDYPAPYMLGTCATIFGTESGTTMAPMSFMFYGHTKQVQRALAPGVQNYKVICYGTTGTGVKNVYVYAGAAITYYPGHSQQLDAVNISFPSGATVVSRSGSSGNATLAIFESSKSVVNSGFSFFAMAPKKAVIGIIQDHIRPTGPITGHGGKQSDNYVQYADPTKLVYLNNGYTQDQDGVTVQTQFKNWPAYITGTPLVKEAAATTSDMVTLGAANSGVLRSDTIYEFTFSIFDKSIGYETNVFPPVKILTADEDFVSLSIFRQTSGSYIAPINYTNFPLIVSTSAGFAKLNWLQYRVYYRALGTFEWIPAGIIEAPNTVNGEVLRFDLCKGDIAALPGGQPGGFNDYSLLPDAQYTSTLFFQRRLFWMDDKNLVFSNLDNPFAYSVRNAVNCPRGRFLGMIPHAAPGEIQQRSRLVIFGSEETYAARFLGQNYQTSQPVRVSENSVADFPVDGSDFYVDVWTSVTAFSGRAAVVADGILYFWGPSGIRRDNGSELPDRLSYRLEPDIFSYYDPSKVDEIFAVYNARTKEIIWFYRPSTTLSSSKTRALVYQVEKDAFYHYDFGNIFVDWAQETDVTLTNTTNRTLEGKRIVCGVRDTVVSTTQRAVFFDDLCKAGDWSPSRRDFVVSIALVSGTTYRFYLSSDGPVDFASSGNITVFESAGYLDSATNSFDGIYPYSNKQVISGGTFNGLTAIDVSFAGVSVVPTAFNNLGTPRRYMPVWFHSFQSFIVRIRSEYWAPQGNKFWGQWVHSHTLYKLDLIQGTAPSLTYKYYTLIGTGSGSRTVTLSDNSRGHCQVYNQIVDTQQNNQGQAISIEILASTDGSYCGNRWVLQYISFDVLPMDKGSLKHFEG